MNDGNCIIEDLSDEVEAVQFEIDGITLQLAENLSWIAKAEHAKTIKLRQLMKMQAQLGAAKKAKKKQAHQATGE